MRKRRICIITGTRAEYELLVPLLTAIKEDSDFLLQLIATGMHLSPEFGMTCHSIEADRFRIDRRVEMLLSSDTSSGTAKSMGVGMIGLADALGQLSPDLMVLTGDRFEMLAAAQTALIARIPSAHIAGGDTTEGAFDEAIRHSITKMSHIHFVTNEASWRRVRQLGENPEQIYTVGSLGLDRIKNLTRLSRSELEKRLDFKLRKVNLLITFHPVTMDSDDSGRQFRNLLDVLHDLGSETGLIFTKPNADPGGRELVRLMKTFEARHPNSVVRDSLGGQTYLSLIPCVDAVVGNSSSGIYEVPSFKKPSVNIGARQEGRLMASSVICCAPEKTEIREAIQTALAKDCSGTINPYGGGDAAEKIMGILRAIPDYKALLKKHFFNL